MDSFFYTGGEIGMNEKPRDLHLADLALIILFRP